MPNSIQVTPLRKEPLHQKEEGEQEGPLSHLNFLEYGFDEDHKVMLDEYYLINEENQQMQERVKKQ